MNITRAWLVAATLVAGPAFANPPSVKDDVERTTVVQIESGEPALRMTVDGAPFTVSGQAVSWTLVDKNPDTDDLGPYLKAGSRLCLETASSAGCHVVAKGKVALFVVHQGGKAYYIEIRM